MRRSEPLPLTLDLPAQEATGRFLEPVPPLSLVLQLRPLPPVLDGMRLVERIGLLLPQPEPRPSGVLLMPVRALSGKQRCSLLARNIVAAAAKRKEKKNHGHHCWFIFQGMVK